MVAPPCHQSRVARCAAPNKRPDTVLKTVHHDGIVLTWCWHTMLLQSIAAPTVLNPCGPQACNMGRSWPDLQHKVLRGHTFTMGSFGIRTPTLFRCLVLPVLKSMTCRGKFLLAGSRKVYCRARRALRGSADTLWSALQCPKHQQRCQSFEM